MSAQCVCYDSVFAYVSYQFCGHIPEYLIANTRHLCLFYFETRFGKKKHHLEWYEDGVKAGERELSTSGNIFLYYFLWFWHGNRWLFRFAGERSGRTLVFCGHPVNLFAMSFQKLFHRVAYSYWIGDYFPARSFVIRCFERLKKFYHDRVDYVWYLSDAINRVENGTVRNESVRRTVAWGVRMHPGCNVDRRDSRQLLFVGLLRRGQGLESIVEFISSNPDYRLAIIGEAANGYDVEVRRMIEAFGATDRVFFPNRFYSQNELLVEARKSFAGIALYDTVADNFTHYADPGKVKAYLEMGLPVIMTRISDVVPWLERFQAGVIVDSLSEVGSAARRIVEHAEEFRRGVADFVAHFDYERYYRTSFAAMEEGGNG